MTGTLPRSGAAADRPLHVIDIDDTMAACDPDAAIWVVMTQDAGHQVLGARNATDRVDKTYAATTPPRQFTLDAPGATEIKRRGPFADLPGCSLDVVPPWR